MVKNEPFLSSDDPVTETTVQDEEEEEEEEVTEEEDEQEEEEEKETRGAKKTKGKKGNKGRKSRASGMSASSGKGGLGKYRSQLICANCKNSMLQTKELNETDVKGKKIPKGADGEPIYESPGASRATGLIAVFCDNCKAQEEEIKKTNPDYEMTPNYAVAVRKDGTVQNIRVQELPDS